MIDLYYAPTPNGWKVAIMLEECGLQYRTTLVQLHQGEQFAPEFMAISPNAKMPAIVDHDASPPVSLFESAAILLYLSDKTGRFAPTEARARLEMMQWMFWQASNQGPIAGQLAHFVNYAPAGQEYGKQRYLGEYDRNLAVLENRLEDREYILDEYSIVDMLAFPWAFIARPLGSSLAQYPNVAAWRGRIKARPAVHRAIELHKDKQNRGEHDAANNPVLYNQTGAHIRRGKLPKAD